MRATSSFGAKMPMTPHSSWGLSLLSICPSLVIYRKKREVTERSVWPCDSFHGPVVVQDFIRLLLLELRHLCADGPVGQAEDFRREKRGVRRLEHHSRRDAGGHAQGRENVCAAEGFARGRAGDDGGGDHAVGEAGECIAPPRHGDIHFGARVGFVLAEHMQDVLGRLVRRADAQHRVEGEATRRLGNFLAVGLVRFGTHENDDERLCHRRMPAFLKFSISLGSAGYAPGSNACPVSLSYIEMYRWLAVTHRSSGMTGGLPSPR